MIPSPRSIRYHCKHFLKNHVHFLQLHYLYIALIIFIFAGLFYCQTGTSWAFIDAFFMATTACTNTGINTIPVSNMSDYQVSVLYFSSFFGSHIVISFVVVLVRKHYFSKRFQEVVLFNKARKLRERQRWHQSTHNGRPKITLLQSTGNIGSYYDGLAHHTSSGSIGSYLMKMTTASQRDYPSQQQQKPSELRISIDPNEKSGLPTTMHQHEHEHEYELENEKSNSQHTPSTIESHQEEPTDHIIDSRIASKSSFDMFTTTNGGPNIIFAENVEQQREDARQRLEKRRQLEMNGQDLGHRRQHSATTDGYRQYQDGISIDGDSGGGGGRKADVLSLAPDQAELTKEQRYTVGGAEYRALDLLTIVIPLYYLVVVIGLSFALRIYIAVSPYAQNVLLTSNGNKGPVNPWYFSFFLSLSSMNNMGLSHIDASMAPFQNAPFPLLVCGFLILAGNTAYPIFLRFTLWCMYRVTPRSYTMHRETLRYLLDHPRRCYTTLFPSLQTWWLLGTLLVINLTEVIVYTTTNFWLPVMDGIPVASQVLDGLFQAIATRNAGFSVVNLAQLNPGTILVYIVAMYIGVYPVAISMRNSNVYQERSLGMYRIKSDLPNMNNYDDSDSTSDGGFILKIRRHRTINSMMTTSKKIFSRPDFFVMTQIQRQLTKDICWVVTGIFCICVLEAQSMISPSPVTFMSVVYECVSAFGCVGGSLGGSVAGTSQSVDYRTVSKLVLIILMYRGRHRGLPAVIDRAVLLPSDQLNWADTEEQQQQQQLLQRCPSCVTTATGNGLGDNNEDIRVIYHRSDTV